MALEAVVFPQDPLSYGCKDNYLYTLIGGGSSSANWNTHFQASEDNKEKNVNDSFIGVVNNNIIEQSINANWDSVSSSSPESLSGGASFSVPPSSSSVEATVTAEVSAATTGRRKRRRTKSVKNKEEIENQRMTHIAVERNRRKQMNEYLAVLRSLMPPSYVQRGDQASIIGGAINFVKELEQLLQCMKSQKKKNHQLQQQAQKEENNNNNNTNDDLTAFAEFFMFPQYSTRETTHNCKNKVYPATSSTSEEVMMMMMQQENKSLAVADIEVSLVDSHANMKILSKKQPGLFVKMVVGLQTLGFTILHLNVTRANDMVLTSVTVKVEEECQLNTVDEIAAAVNQLLRTIHEEVAFSAD